VMVSALAAFSSACAPVEDSVEETGSNTEAITSGWTPFVSEETPPVICDSGSLITATQCTGSYCDNTRLFCSPTSGTKLVGGWTPYFSDEGSGTGICPPGQWATGFACRGRYCDNVSLECSTIGGVTQGACFWSGWHSEEFGGVLSLPPGHAVRGMQCSGSYCDSHRYLICSR
jgi:hypothetical protein